MQKKLYAFLFSLVLLVSFQSPNSAIAEAGSIAIEGYDINYDLENGEIFNIYLDPDFAVLIVEFETISDGVLEITIPRSLLDSKFSETEDDIFFVLIDGFETEFLETETTVNSRTLAIPFFDGDTQIEVLGTTVLTPTEEILAEEPSIEIPPWVKNNAGWWADGQIGDSDFVSGIKYLITQGIMTIPETEAGEATGESIPAWVKNNAGWWADGQIGDSDFVSGIKYLITQGIMTV